MLLFSYINTILYWIVTKSKIKLYKSFFTFSAHKLIAKINFIVLFILTSSVQINQSKQVSLYCFYEIIQLLCILLTFLYAEFSFPFEDRFLQVPKKSKGLSYRQKLSALFVQPQHKLRHHRVQFRLNI